MRFSLISLMLLLCIGPAFAAIGSDFVSFSWEAAASDDENNGGGATRTAWDGGSPSDFLNTTTGAAIDTAAGATVKDGTTTVNFVSVGDFANVVNGTIAQIRNYTGDDVADGFFVVNRIDDDEIALVGTTYVDDAEGVETADINVGGVHSGIDGLNGTDLMDASTVNCDVLIKGNETLGNVDTGISAGGGTDTTTLHWIGVDTNWAEIALTATSGWPVITQGGFHLLFSTDVVTVKAVSFTSSDASRTIQVTGEYVSFISVTMVNTGAGDAFETTTDSAVTTNCSFIGDNATQVVDFDKANMYGCFVKQLGTGDGVLATVGFGGGNITKCVIFSSGAGGTGIVIDEMQNANSPVNVVNNTIDTWDTCLHFNELPDTTLDTSSMLITNNLFSDWDTNGISKTDADERGPIIINNAFWDTQEVGGATDLENMPILLSITLTGGAGGDPYVAQGSNYTINNTAGAGALLRAATFPGARLDNVHTDFGDVGAIQHEDSGGGGYVGSHSKRGGKQ